MLTLDELRDEVVAETIDTVVVAFTDMQGRLMGKRVDADFFLEELEAGHPVEGCNYLLALEMEMDPVPGYEIAGWERGYGDFGLRPDLAHFAPDPVARGDGARVVRCVVARRCAGGAIAAPGLARPDRESRSMGLAPMFGSELEFFLFRESYAEANAMHYRELTPSVPYILDYHVLATTYDEPLIRAIRMGMKGAGRGGELKRRGRAGSTRDQLPLLGRDPDR